VNQCAYAAALASVKLAQMSPIKQPMSSRGPLFAHQHAQCCGLWTTWWHANLPNMQVRQR